MAKLKMNLKEYLYYSGMKKCVFCERSGISPAVLYKILTGGDYNMSTALKLMEASSNIICPIALLKEIKPRQEPSPDHPKKHSCKPPKHKKDKVTKLKI